MMFIFQLYFLNHLAYDIFQDPGGNNDMFTVSNWRQCNKGVVCEVKAGTEQELIPKGWPGTQDWQWEAVNGARPQEGSEQCYRI